MATVETTPDQLAGPLAELLEARYALADPAGRVTRWGTGSARLFGVQGEQMLGRSLFETALGGADGGWAAMTAAGGGVTSVVFDCELSRPDGQTLPCRVRLLPVRLADGLEVSFLAGDLAGDESPREKLELLRARHARALELVEASAADGAVVEPGERLAGLIATFEAELPATGARAAEMDEAVERAERAESELEHLRVPLEQARAEGRALADRLDRLERDMAARLERLESRDDEVPAARVEQLEGELRERLERAASDAEAARSEAEQARREAEQARRELRGARHAFGGHPSPAGFFSHDSQPQEPERPSRPGFDDALEPIARLALDGSFMELNPGFRDRVGYSEEEFASARWPSAADRDRLEEQRSLLRGLAAGELDRVEVESSYMHREGLLVELSGRLELVRSPSGAPDHLMLTLDAR
jgi:PAS domain S-box-containing protein